MVAKPNPFGDRRTAIKKVTGPQVVTGDEVAEMPLPAEIQEALGELVGAAREGLLALSVGVGLRVVHELMESEVTEVVGPKGKWNPDREAHDVGGERRPFLGELMGERPMLRSAHGQIE